MGDSSYCTWKWDDDVDYLGRFRKVIGSINFADPANIRQICGILINELRDEATYINNKYIIQIEPMQFKWDKFLPMLEKDFPDILKEVLSCINQQHQSISNVNNSMPNKYRSRYNTVIANWIRMLTLGTNTNGACKYEHISQSIPENNTYGGNYHALHHTHHGWQRTETTTTQFHFHHHIQTMISETFTTGDQQGKVLGFITFCHTYPHEYSNNVSHAHNNSENDQQSSQNAGPTTFIGNSLALVMVEQTILQAALTSVEMFDCTKRKFKAWMEAVKMPHKFQVKIQYTQIFLN